MTEKTISGSSVLAVSRDAALIDLLHSIQQTQPWHLETVETAWDAMERVLSEAAVNLLLLDVPVAGADSLHLLRWLRRHRPHLPVIAVCHAEDRAGREEAGRLRAGEILVRPLVQHRLQTAIGGYLAMPPETEPNLDANMEANLEREILSQNVDQISPDAFFVSASLAMKKLRAQAALLAQSDVPVLILGEPGSGKNAVASLIHKLSVRSGFRLHRVRCGEMPAALLESELFGDDNGGSTTGRRPLLGQFASGERGTIYLDEITELTLGLQHKLTQVLRAREFPGPANNRLTSEVRILAGSSRDLEAALAEKRLREDLYYRLSAFTVQVPALRQRKDEIGILLRYFMHKLAKHYRMPARGFSPALLDVCEHHDWPGNLKEMEIFVKRYLVAGSEELPAFSGDAGAAAQDPENSSSASRNPLFRLTQAPSLSTAFSQEPVKPESLKSLIRGIKSEAEQTAIGAALKQTHWNRKAAARLLSVSYRTLLYKIDQYNMRAPSDFSPLPSARFSIYDEVKGNGKAS